MSKLIWRNLLRNKRRTLLTLLSLVMALVLLCFLNAFLTLIENAHDTAETRVVVRSAISLLTPLPEAYWQRLQAIDHVTAVCPFSFFQGTYKDNRAENSFARFAVDPPSLFKVYPEYAISAEEKAAWERDRAGFVAGAALARKHGWKIGDQIFLQGDLYPADLNLTLRGIAKWANGESGENVIYFHRRYLEEATGNPGLAQNYFLTVDRADHVEGVIKTAEAMFQNSDYQVRAETEENYQLSFLRLLGNVRLLFMTIGLAVVVSIFFITANTMAMAARERTSEVGVLRTLGFGRGRVMSLVLCESLAVGVLGAVLGCALASWLLSLLAKAMAKVSPIFALMAVSPQTWAIGLGVGLTVGLLSGIFPGVSAARMRITDALRRVA